MVCTWTFQESSRREAQVNWCFSSAASFLFCLTSLLAAATTASSQDRAATDGPGHLKDLLLRPDGWTADWIGPSGDSSGQAEWVYEARGERIVARLRNTFRSDGATLLGCEQSVSIGQDRVTHDGCMDFSIELFFDPQDQDYPFKGKSPRGYRYKFKAR